MIIKIIYYTCFTLWALLGGLHGGFTGRTAVRKPGSLCTMLDNINALVTCFITCDLEKYFIL